MMGDEHEEEGGLGEEAAGPLERDLRAMEGEAGSGIAMCHAQGKTAVYLPASAQRSVSSPLT